MDMEESETHEQPFLHTDDSHYNYAASFCSLQFGSDRPAIPEPRSLEASVQQQQSGISATNQQEELVSHVAHDESMMSENGEKPVIFDEGYIAVSHDLGHMTEPESLDNGIGAGVCIGTIGVHEHGNMKQSAAAEAAGPIRIQVSASTSTPGNRIDYGESVAMEDFGGEFEDGFGIEESAFGSVSVFADSELKKMDTTNAAAVETEVSDASAEVPTAEAPGDAVDTGPEEQEDIPEILDKIPPKSPLGAGSTECEEEPPVLEKEDIPKAGNLKNIEQREEETVENRSTKLPSRRSGRQRVAEDGRRTSDMEQTTVSNVELNVNSRPRRSVNRKSVFELLHVDYRYSGGPKKVATHRASDGDANHEAPAKKEKSSRKGTKISSEHLGDDTERPVKTKRFVPTRHDHIDDIDERISAIRKKVVGYKPDDFLDDGDAEQEATNSAEVEQEKSTLDADRSLLKESVFSEADDIAARSFLSTFAAESDEALSSKQTDVGSELEVLTAENQQLRSRIKALEQSKSLVKKFNIDFHSRKFSRIRSPAAVSADQQKTPGKIPSVFDKTPASQQKAPVETGESILSRMAALDRRELKLRELSAELDERATTVKISEGALRRKERKLLDFEKTLEHRERVLSRHEQSILKRELVLGSPTTLVDGAAAEEGEDRLSLATEIQRRLEQRRLELDRRKAALNSERTRLEIREQELDQREASSRMAGESFGNKDEDEDVAGDTADRSSSRPSRSLTSIGKQKRKSSVSHSIRSKYLSAKKQKVLVESQLFEFDLTLVQNSEIDHIITL